MLRAADGYCPGDLPSRLAAEARPPGLSQPAEAAIAAAPLRTVEGRATDGFARPNWPFVCRSGRGGEVDVVVFPGPLAAESTCVDAAAVGDACAARQARLGHPAGAVGVRSLGTRGVPPGWPFAWLLDQP
ncbi:MAG TPA: hypothetical protein VFC93_16410 [Chloroflexota bacterium]|nr:hypothetical protein [Chloroflexota bacterium]